MPSLGEFFGFGFGDPTSVTTASNKFDVEGAT